MNERQISLATPAEHASTAKSPPHGYIPPRDVASNRAMTALILGILSIMCTGFLTGIPAIIMGKMELIKIKAGKSNPAGNGIARAGFVLGIVGTVLTCLIVLTGIALIALAAFMGTSEPAREVARQISLTL
jgi:hypothetical protein